jgi:hypothetical protein
LDPTVEQRFLSVLGEERLQRRVIIPFHLLFWHGADFSEEVHQAIEILLGYHVFEIVGVGTDLALVAGTGPDIDILDGVWYSNPTQYVPDGALITSRYEVNPQITMETLFVKR